MLAAVTFVLLLTPVTDTLDLRIRIRQPAGSVAWWGKDATLELSLHERDRPERWYSLASLPGGNSDCLPRVERATATDTVITCVPEKGRASLRHKFVYDVRAKALVKHFEYDFSQTHRLVPDPRRDPPFRIGPALPLDSGPPKKAPFSVPKSSYESFAKARPARVKDGYAKGHTSFMEEIGPTQREGSLTWFAKTFYDGEGITGVGGFGYYDGRTKRTRLWSPSEIAAWSASAILVEDAAIWVGLCHHAEWASTSGGLLRFDRAAEAVTVIPLPDTIGGIVRDGDRLLLETEFGGAMVAGDQVRRFFVDQTSDGRIRIAEGSVQGP